MSFTYNPPTGLSFLQSPPYSGTLSWTDSTPIVNNCSLLLHCDGVNGSTSFVDSSGNNTVMTAAHGMQIDTATPMFGTGAAESTATNSVLSTPCPAGGILDISSGDFTVELFIRPSQFSGLNEEYFEMGMGTSFAGGGLYLYNPGATGSGEIYCEIFMSGSPVIISGFGVALGPGNWVHTAVYRSGSFFYIAVNGKVLKMNTSADTNTLLWPTGTNNLQFGAGHWTTTKIGTQFDEVRITKGAALYGSSNFTPPAAPFNPGTPPPGYEIFRNGTSIGTVTAATAFADTVPGYATYAYTVAAWDGVSTDISDQSTPLNVTFAASVSTETVYGKFVPAAVFKPSTFPFVGLIEPRVWIPKENITVRT